MESTVDNPLAFFEYITQEQNFNNYVYDILLLQGDFLTYEIENFTTIKYKMYDEYNEVIEGTTQLKRYLTPRIRAEFEKSKKLLQDFYIQNEERNISRFFKIQINTIQHIVDTNYTLINNYPDLLFALRGIVNFINVKLTPTEPYQLNQEKIKISDKEISDRELVHSIFDYMRGENERRELILNEDDFELLIQNTLYLVKEEDIPIIEDKISPNLKQGVLSFSYWVLHKELYKKKRINDKYITFLKLFFEQFNNTDEKSIKNQFGSKTRLFPHDFLPEIITKYLEN